MVMATGDNILTAISVSKECKLIKGDSIVYSCEIEKDNEGNDNLIWNKVENYDDLNLKKKLTEEEFLNLKINNQNSKSINTNLNDSFNKSNNISNFSSKYPAEDVKLTTKLKQNEDFNDSINGESNIIKEENKQSQKKENNSIETEISAVNINDEISPSKTLGDNYVIALTGPTFEKLSKLNERYLKTKDPSLKNSHNTFRQILKNGIIFARMAPEHKALLVESFRKETFTVLMCGDGANDCAALRSADVGVSLSPEEASIAAHFTSKIPDISCLVKLLREGKCSLTTSIQTFKYMMLYSLIQFIAVSLLMIFQSYLTDFQFLASDLFIIFPLALFIAKTAPYEKLTFHYPQASLLSFPVICSILIQTIICFAFQFGGREVLKETNDWYVNTCETEGDEVFACEDNSVFFLISHYQYLTTALAFSVSKPFRKAIYTNWLLMIYLILVFFYSIWITINCDSWSKNLFGLYTFPKKNFKYYLFIVICVNFVISIFCEWVIMGFVRTCWEGVEIRRYRNEVKKSENDPDYEYNLCHYHRIYYYDRREKMKEDSENKNNNLDNNVNLNNENQVVAEQKQMENGSNEINEN
jgi:cation-transporting ATPase 13A3/4/5